MKNILNRIADKISSNCDAEIICNYDMASVSSIKAGGIARMAVLPGSVADLVSVLDIIRKSSVSFKVLGNITNTICCDGGFDGVVIKTDKLSSLKSYDDKIYAECGASLFSICNLAFRNALTGCENLYGVPGSFGGALYMNAGAFGSSVSDILYSYNCYDILTGETRTVESPLEGFSYRKSPFSSDSNLIVLSGVIRLSPGNKNDIKKAMAEIMSRRKSSQPLDFPSCGSFFKRGDGFITSKIIDEAGLKGLTCGGAKVSEKHAGFIINYNNASVKDIFDLSETVIQRIKTQYGYDIFREVEFFGNR